MKLRRKSPWIATNLFMMFTLLSGSALSQASSNAAGISPLLANAQNLGLENPSKPITVTVWLKQRNKAALDELVHQMYEPASPTYHHWLTRDEYRSRFAPTAESAAQVREYLTAHSLHVTSADKFNHYLVAQGRVSDVQNAFNVQLNRYNMNGHIHRVSNASATIPGAVGELVMGVTGLNDFAAKPALARRIDPGTGKPVGGRPLSATSLSPSATPTPCLNGAQTVSFTTSPHHGPAATYSGNSYATLGSDGTTCSYIPSQIQTAYGFNSLYSNGWDGTGQTIVIVDAYNFPTIQQDANAFSAAYGLPALTSSNFQVDYPGRKTPCGKTCIDYDWDGETQLDVEWAHAMAPGANIALVVATDSYSLDIAELWAIENPEATSSPYANGVLGYVISNSWVLPELLYLVPGGEGALDTELAMTELAAALGISANFASGDHGDEVADLYNNYGITAPPSVDMPASSPYSTGVGGVSLFLDTTDQIEFQTGWGNNGTVIAKGGANHPYDPPVFQGFLEGSGGGTSAVWPEPSFQSSLGNTYRQVPDISFLADRYTGVSIIQTVHGVQTLYGSAGGTSLATPIFSALWTIANQAAGTAAPLGQAAPMLYSLPAGAITDIVPVDNGSDVSGTITDPPNPVLTETAADLAQPLVNTTTFLSALVPTSNANGRSMGWYVLSFGTDTSLFTAPGWDNVTGLGVPNSLEFVQAVVAAAP